MGGNERDYLGTVFCIVLNVLVLISVLCSP